MVTILAMITQAMATDLERCYPHEMFQEAFCGTVSVPEDHGNPAGKRLELSIQVIPSIRANAKDDPVFVFAGGPGQGAVEVSPMMMPSLMKINQKRTIVFIDQRGTGESNPLQCEIETKQTEEIEPKQLKNCLELLEADTRLYTTQDLVKDTAIVQKTLGYAKVNLYGVSYGTRLGLAYLREYPELVRSAVLDGVAPVDIPIGSDFGEAARNAFQQLLQDCDGEDRCHKAFPELRQEIEQLEERLTEAKQIQYSDPVTNEKKTEGIDRDQLWGIIQQMLYDPTSSSMLPFVLHQAYLDNWNPLMAWANMGDDMFEAIPIGLYLSIICAEDYPRIDYSLERKEEMGVQSTKALADMCQVWPTAAIADAFFMPVSSSVPILLLSGENDPVTPPKNGDHALSSLSNAIHVIIPGAAHNTLRTECTLNIMKDFINTIEPQNIDTKCVSDLHRPPFIVAHFGTTP